MTAWHALPLACGATVCVAEMPWMESVSLGVWAGVGGRHDPAHLSGLAHFAEHMVFKGTRRRTARRLNTEVESAGGTMDAYTSEDHTSFFIRGPAEHFPRFADVLFDLYRHSVFAAEEVKKEREVIAEEIAMYREQPQQLVEDLICQTAWPDHPLGRSIAGTEESLKSILTTPLRRHAATWFGRKNTVISVAGRVAAPDVQRVLDKVIGTGFPEGQRPATQPFTVPRRRIPSVGTVVREIDQMQVSLGFHAPGRHSRQAYALRLLSVLLGENTSSRLWTELRERRGLCYDAGSDVTSLEDTGFLHLFAGVDPDRLDLTLTVILRELRRFATTAVTPRALRAACDYTIGSGRMAMEGSGSQMTAMAESVLFHGRMIPAEESWQKLREITPEEVRRVAARLFQPGNASLALVGPAEGREVRLREMVRTQL